MTNEPLSGSPRSLSPWYTHFCVIPSYNVLESVCVVKRIGQKGWYITFTIWYNIKGTSTTCARLLSLSLSLPLSLCLCLSFSL